MTDYLTRLARRTLGLLPVAEPLVTPLFSSFALKMRDRPELSLYDNAAPHDQKVIPGAQNQEKPEAFPESRPKAQKIARSSENSLEKEEHSFGGNKNDSLLPQTSAPSKDTGVINEEISEELESVTLLDQTPERLKNNGHRRNPGTVGPKTEKKMTGSIPEQAITGSISEQAITGPISEKELTDSISEQITADPMPEQAITGSISGKEMKDTDIPYPISVSKSLEDPFSEKYEGGHHLSGHTLDFKTESQRSIDTFSENHADKKENLNKKPNLDTSGHELNPNYPVTPGILREREKDPSVARDQEPHEMDRKTYLKNPIAPVIKISDERKDHVIREIHTKIRRSPTPTIKVTIGRVEVRAVPPQPVSRPSPAVKKPALSLDEYLKRHNG